MRKLLISTAAMTCFATPAIAHYYNARYSCGVEAVSISDPVEGHGAARGRKLIVEMPANFDQPTVVRFDPDKEALTLNGRHCRRVRD